MYTLYRAVCVPLLAPSDVLSIELNSAFLTTLGLTGSPLFFLVFKKLKIALTNSLSLIFSRMLLLNCPLSSWLYMTVDCFCILAYSRRVLMCMNYCNVTTIYLMLNYSVDQYRLCESIVCVVEAVKPWLMKTRTRNRPLGLEYCEARYRHINLLRLKYTELQY